jgi:hypothetical protein
MIFAVFENFLRELAVAFPTADLAPLEAVLHNIESQPDDLALTLFGPVRWTVRQTQYPPAVRLEYISHLLARATASTDPPHLLH